MAVFGKKDYQQLAIIRRLVRDLNMGIDIRGMETVRESDGLAMSSRNSYLSDDQRQQAPALRRALLAANTELPETRWWQASRNSCRPRRRSDRSTTWNSSMQNRSKKSRRSPAQPALLAAAILFGKTRLIDNLEISQ